MCSVSSPWSPSKAPSALNELEVPLTENFASRRILTPPALALFCADSASGLSGSVTPPQATSPRTIARAARARRVRRSTALCVSQLPRNRQPQDG